MEWAYQIVCNDIRARFLDNIMRPESARWRGENGYSDSYETLAKALQHAFIWDTSPEGDRFWEFIKDNYVACESEPFCFQVNITDVVHLLPSPVAERRNATNSQQIEVDLHVTETWDEIFQRFEYEKGISIFAVNEFRKWVVEKYQAPSGKLEIIF